MSIQNKIDNILDNYKLNKIRKLATTYWNELKKKSDLDYLRKFAVKLVTSMVFWK